MGILECVSLLRRCVSLLLFRNLFENIVYNQAMNNKDILGEIDLNVLKAADSLPALLDSVESGEAVEPHRLTFARRAAATVTKVADLLAVATNIFGMAGGEYCRACIIHYRNLGRIIISLCPRHSNISIPQFRERYAVPSRRARHRHVLDYLSRMYGHGREVTCAVCSVEVGGMKDNNFRVPPVGGGALRNGVNLIFNQCHHEDLHRDFLRRGARQQA